jgi:hypothetical protein
MPNPSRQKGDRFERQIVAFLQERGINAERIPLSGSSPFGSFSGYDLTVPILGTTLRAECKHIGGGFKTIYKWLDHGQNEFLVIRADRSPPLAVIPLDLLVSLTNPTTTKKDPAASKRSARIAQESSNANPIKARRKGRTASKADR